MHKVKLALLDAHVSSTSIRLIRMRTLRFHRSLRGCYGRREAPKRRREESEKLTNKARMAVASGKLWLLIVQFYASASFELPPREPRPLSSV